MACLRPAAGLRLIALLVVPTLVSAASTDGDWPMPAKDYASTRYSPLAEISTANVSKLQLTMTFSTGVLRGHESAPIVANGMMYLITPYPNVVYALDLAQAGAPVRWRFEPKPEAFAQGPRDRGRVPDKTSTAISRAVPPGTSATTSQRLDGPWL